MTDPRSLFWLVASVFFGVLFLAVGMVVAAELLMRGADRREARRRRLQPRGAQLGRARPGLPEHQQSRGLV